MEKSAQQVCLYLLDRKLAFKMSYMYIYIYIYLFICLFIYLMQLMRENAELRDLCCFLDDGRQKTRRIAHEWQCFAKYTAAVLKNEVAEFETKLGILQVGIYYTY